MGSCFFCLSAGLHHSQSERIVIALGQTLKIFLKSKSRIRNAAAVAALRRF